MINYDNLSTASHEIKNLISFINSSYQIMQMQHPETKDYKFWDDMGDYIKKLIYFMDRTTIYRYCTKPDIEEFNITELLYQIPDEIDNANPDKDRELLLDIDNSNIWVNGDREQILTAILEVVNNCYDVTSESDIIEINCHLDEKRKYYVITISNSNPMPDIEFSKAGIGFDHTENIPKDCKDILCKPFYTTKKNHVGIGLSIADCVCRTHSGYLEISHSNGITSVRLLFPISRF